MHTTGVKIFSGWNVPPRRSYQPQGSIGQRSIGDQHLGRNGPLQGWTPRQGYGKQGIRDQQRDVNGQQGFGHQQHRQ